MTASFKDVVASIIDGQSGGIKGIELLSRLFQERILNPELPKVNDLDAIAEVVEGEMPQFGVLRYGMKLDEDLYREKFFFYRRMNGHGNGPLT